MALCAAAAAAAAAAKAAAVWLATRAKLVEVEVVTAAAAEAPPQVIPPATGHAREKEQEQSFSCSIVETSRISQHFSVSLVQLCLKTKSTKPLLEKRIINCALFIVRKLLLK